MADFDNLPDLEVSTEAFRETFANLFALKVNKFSATTEAASIERPIAQWGNLVDGIGVVLQEDYTERRVAGVVRVGAQRVYAVTADPEGDQVGNPGDLALRSNGLVYRKASGSGTDTGWVDIVTGTVPGWDEVLAVERTSGATSPQITTGQQVEHHDGTRVRVDTAYTADTYRVRTYTAAGAAAGVLTLDATVAPSLDWNGDATIDGAVIVGGTLGVTGAAVFADLVTAAAVTVTAGGIVVSAGGVSVIGASSFDDATTFGSTVTISAGLTVTSGGATVSNGNVTASNGALVASGALEASGATHLFGAANGSVELRLRRVSNSGTAQVSFYDGATATWAARMEDSSELFQIWNAVDAIVAYQITRAATPAHTLTGTVTCSGLVTASAGLTVSTVGLIVSAGGAAVTGNSSVTGTLGVSSNITSTGGDVSCTAGSVTAGGVGATTGRVVYGRAHATGGTPLVGATHLALSAGWGTTASVSAINARDSGGSFTITSAGTGQGASPTVTVTFADGTWTSAPVVILTRGGGTAAATRGGRITSVTAAGFVATYDSTPLTGETHEFHFMVHGR
jgi:hypothetical protein